MLIVKRFISSTNVISRKSTMLIAKNKSELKKSNWQKFMTNTVDLLRPIASILKPVILPVLDYPSKKRVENAVNIEDLRIAAEKRAHSMVFAYLDGGADAERALKKSVNSFHNIQLKHPVLHGVGNGEVDLTTNILGIESKLPFFISSCAGQRMFHADGEIATAKAAKKHGCVMALSQLTTSRFEDIRTAHPEGAKVLQLYVWKDKALLKDVLDRAKECGYTSLALTADFSWVGNRERETRTGFTIPPSYSIRQCIDALKSPAWTYDYISRKPYGYKAIPEADFPAESLVDFIANQMKPEFNWDDARWLCDEWGDTGPVALKGVAQTDDAIRALDCGFKSLWLSNHGGRQLEDSVPTLEVVSKIRNTVGNDTEIILDGGIRRGIDIIKALSCGADSVAIGRAYLYGLAAGGYNGVDKALSFLKRDVNLSMGLLGCRNIKELKLNSKNIIV